MILVTIHDIGKLGEKQREIGRVTISDRLSNRRAVAMTSGLTPGGPLPSQMFIANFAQRRKNESAVRFVQRVLTELVKQEPKLP